MKKPSNVTKPVNQNKNKSPASYSLYGNLWSRVIDALDNPLWHNLYSKLSFNVLKRLKDIPRGKTTKGKVAKKVGRGVRK